MSMVVGPAGFTGEEALPAPTRGYLGCYDNPVSGSGSSNVSIPSADLPASGTSAESAMMDRFTDDYLRLMAGRVDLIQHYIDDIRYEEARVAILSLESASGMVGESHLRRLLHDLRLCVDACTSEHRTRSMDEIRTEAAAVQQRLT